jgi:hypothetical protein
MAGVPLGKRAMTATERQRKWRTKLRRERIFGLNADKSARRPQPKRTDLDFWPTPSCLSAALVRHVLPVLPPGPVWECASGDGALVDVITAAGRTVIASDIDRQRRNHLRLDFLKDQPPAETRGAVLITNPPFSKSGLGDPFRRRALGLLDSGHLQAVVLLARADAGGTQGRAGDFNRAAYEFTCCWRPEWIPGSVTTGRWWFVWLAWLAGRSGPPINLRIGRP